MKIQRSIMLVVLAAAGPAAAQTPPAAARAHATPAAAETSRERGAREAIDPRADSALRRMSEYLAGLRSFRVASTAADEVVDRNGRKLQFVSQSRVTMRRPNLVHSERVGPIAQVAFRYNGQEFSLFSPRTGYYATAPAPAQLDQAVDVLRARYGLDIPGADLLSADPYRTLMEDTTSGEYIGLEPIEGAPCHHLAFRGREVDWQIWIQDGAQPLPRRYVISSRRVTGHPQFVVELSRWEPDAATNVADFTLRPPQGATRIELMGARQEQPARGDGRRGR